jgi:hypothetical protein
MEEIIEWGFDLTDFGNSSVFISLLKKHSLFNGYKRIGKKDDYTFSWKNSSVEIRTGNNPIIGQYRSKNRENERGYASYVGIKGEKSAVLSLASDIRNVASIKGESEYENNFIW